MFNWLRRFFGPAPTPTPNGRWVAESWLEWEICRGSTLYRQRFDNFDDAVTSAKRAAKDLDWTLPSKGFGIRWGVRPAGANDNSVQIWSPCLPESPNFRGEHASLHPLNKEPS